MQFQLSPTPHQRRIRRIPTIRLQTMKHIQENCMRNFWDGRDSSPKISHVIRLRELSTKPRNVAIATALLHDLKYPQENYVRNCLGRSGGHRRDRRATIRGPGRGAAGRRRGLAGQRVDAPSEARGADGSRAGRRTPAHTAARPAERNARQPSRAAARSRN